jgi:hypothetical protein
MSAGEDAEDVAPVLYEAYVKGLQAAAPRSPAARELAMASTPAFADLGREYRAGWLAAAAVALQFAQMAADMVPDALRASGVTLTVESP